MIDADQLSFSPLSEDCLLVSWPSVIDMKTIQQVKALGIHLSSIESIGECVPAYASLAIYFDDSLFDHTDLEKLVLDHLESVDTEEGQISTWEIPVCYDPSFGIDQKRFLDEKKVDFEELVHLHTSNSYTVLMRGFQPGFLYMGDLDERLHLPRLAKPRPKVLAGSIAIADGQTGVYPLESPGGWNIIGCTPSRMLDFSSTEIIPVQQGDVVRFTAVGLDDYHQMKLTNDGPGSV